MELQYSKSYDQSLLYSKSPKFLEAITERRVMRELPRTGAGTVKAGGQITFEVSNDSFEDLQSFYVNFDLAIKKTIDDSATTTAAVSNVVDVIESIQVYYNEQLVDDIKNANSWSNVFVAFGATRGYMNSEGKALLGLTNQFTTAQAVSASNGARSYAIPLALVSGFCRSKQYLPILGNKLRIVITLAQNGDVISFKHEADYYQLSNVSLTHDMILTSSKYREDILRAMATEQGIRIPYTAYQTGQLSVNASTTQNIKITNSNSNSLSLHLLHSPEAAKTTAIAALDVWSMTKESYAMPLFTNYSCRSGSRYFTPPDGIKGFVEAYVSAEKCISSACDLSGSGVIDYATFVGDYTTNAAIASGAYGLCVLSANLEKGLCSDDDVLNQGLSANSGGASNDFDITINTSGALASTSLFLYNLVHRRCLTFMNSGVAVEF